MRGGRADVGADLGEEVVDGAGALVAKLEVLCCGPVGVFGGLGGHGAGWVRRSLGRRVEEDALEEW